MASLLRNRGFLALATSQFFGAVNDNILKQLLTFGVIAGGLWGGALGEGGQGIVGLAFTLPFILLSAVAGQVADRWSKRTVTIVVRATELPIAAIGMWGFVVGNLPIAFTALVLLTCQSAFFGPPKYGMIPELVETRQIARTNGAINMFTNVAVILGIVAGGWIYDQYVEKVEGAATGERGAMVERAAAADAGEPNGRDDDGDDGDDGDDAGGGAGAAGSGDAGGGGAAGGADGGGAVGADERTLAAVEVVSPWLPGAVLLLVAAMGLLCAWFLPPMKAGSPGLHIGWNPISGYVSAMKDMARGPLLAVALAWGSFYLIAGMSLLILPEYANLLPNGSAWQASQLMGILGIAIGVGSLVTGHVSGDTIRVGLVPIGAVGLSLFLVGLGLFSSSSFAAAALMLLGAGFFAGFYIIPLQALLQHLAPVDERGRFIGTSNAINFAFLAIASALYAVIRPLFGDEDTGRPDRIFLVSAVLMLSAAGIFTAWFRRHRGAFEASGVSVPGGARAPRASSAKGPERSSDDARGAGDSSDTSDTPTSTGSRHSGDASRSPRSSLSDDAAATPDRSRPDAPPDAAERGSASRPAPDGGPDRRPDGARDPGASGGGSPGPTA